MFFGVRRKGKQTEKSWQQEEQDKNVIFCVHCEIHSKIYEQNFMLVLKNPFPFEALTGNVGLHLLDEGEMSVCESMEDL